MVPRIYSPKIQKQKMTLTQTYPTLLQSEAEDGTYWAKIKLPAGCISFWRLSESITSFISSCWLNSLLWLWLRSLFICWCSQILETTCIFCPPSSSILKANKSRSCAAYTSDLSCLFFHCSIFLWPTLLSSSSIFKDSCGYIGPTQVIKIISYLKVPFAM